VDLFLIAAKVVVNRREVLLKRLVECLDMYAKAIENVQKQLSAALNEREYMSKNGLCYEDLTKLIMELVYRLKSYKAAHYECEMNLHRLESGHHSDRFFDLLETLYPESI
jgi:hypothetical protein